jgi:microcystin-dependent protein
VSSPYVGEIRMFGGNFAPVGWAFCQGQLLSIDENPTLFQLIGTTYGGDGESTFALPNLASRIPVHTGQNYVLGEAGGEETVTLTTQQIPAHAHALSASTGTGAQSSPAGNVLASSATVALYSGEAPNVSLAPQSVQATGGSQPHDNMQPFVAINFIISLFGIFPTPN